MQSKQLYKHFVITRFNIKANYECKLKNPEKHQYSILTHIYGIQKDGNNNPVYETAKETLMYRTVLWTLWERKRVEDLGEWH